MKKLSAVILILSILTSTVIFSSCDSKNDNERKSFSLDINTTVTNLDPLLGANTNDYMIAQNAFEGLLMLDSENNLKNGACDSYTVSKDSLTYTFKLKDGLKWSDERAVTSDDFRFMVERVLDKTVDSDYAVYFYSIKGAEDYHSGKKNAASLGIETPDEKTIIFKLSSVDQSFLYTLAQPFAMPCNREFFNECGGKYGLFYEKTLFNGNYTVTGFDNNTITLRANEQYYNQKAISANKITVTQNVSKVDAYNNFYQKNTNILRFEAEDFTEISKYDNSANIVSFYDKTYAITFNLDNEVGGDADFRRMLGNMVDSSKVLKQLSECYTPALGIIPPYALYSGKDYRDTAGKVELIPDWAEAGSAEEAFKAAFEDEGIPKLSIIYPDTLDIKNVMTDLVTPWQIEFGLYINPIQLSNKDFNARLTNGEYQMAIIPYSASDARPLSLLKAFGSEDTNNAHYSSQKFNELLNKASALEDKDSAKALLDCENHLILADNVVIPLFYSSSGFALDKNTNQAVTVIKSGGNILFRYQ